VSVTAIANRYGRALAEVVLEQQQQEAVKQELAGFVTIFAENPDLPAIFSNPVIPQPQQHAILEGLITATKPSTITGNFLHVLLRNYRLHFLPQVYQAFLKIIDSEMNVLMAEITTVSPVGTEEQELLAEKLRKVTGKEVRLQFVTDPEIIGGVVTQIGSKIYDGSIRSQLGVLRTKLAH
jgi:F-type H+-transporting ATPase subunit delta